MLTCCSLAAVPGKSPVASVIAPDGESPLPEDEEKLLPSAEDSET